jgi:hypothetical protein
MTTTDPRALATELIRSTVSDDIDQLGVDEFLQGRNFDDPDLTDEVYRLIRTASITVDWPQDETIAPPAGLDLDAIASDIARHTSAIGPGGDKAWTAGQLAKRAPALVAEVRRLREANANLIENANTLAEEVVFATGRATAAECSRDLLRSHLDEQRPVIDAAKRWARASVATIEHRPHEEALYAAVKDLPEPTHWASPYGGCWDDCPLCKAEATPAAAPA